MEDKYVICIRDTASNRLVYFTGRLTQQGSLYFGSVLEAKRFNSLEEVFELVVSSSCFYLGFNVINIADCTFKAIEENECLFEKFHNPNYAIR